MMPKFKDRKPANAGSRSFFPVIFYLIISIIAGLLLAFSVWYSTRLVVSVIPEGKKGTFSFPTFAGDMWNISLTHSVEKTAWDDYFRVNAVNDLTLTHTRFSSLGWGYPYSAADGKLTPTGDGRFNLEMNRSYKTIDLRISEQAMQHVKHGTEDYDLIALFGQGTAIKIKVQYRFQYWLEIYF